MSTSTQIRNEPAGGLKQKQSAFASAVQSEPTPGVAARAPAASRTVTKEDPNAIRPFHVNVPEAELTELRRRINATRWPERETVTDATQGVQLATVQALCAIGRRNMTGARSKQK